MNAKCVAMAAPQRGVAMVTSESMRPYTHRHTYTNRCVCTDDLAPAHAHFATVDVVKNSSIFIYMTILCFVDGFLFYRRLTQSSTSHTNNKQRQAEKQSKRETRMCVCVLRAPVLMCLYIVLLDFDVVAIVVIIHDKI